MAGCTGHRGNYLTYECYTKLKDYFNRHKILSPDGKGYLEKGIRNMSPEPNNMTLIKPIFEKLATFFNANYAFSFIGQTPSCIYVNYKLNAELKDLKYYELRNKFNFFKDFAKQFSKAYSNNTENFCNHYMNYYSEEKWDIIYILYQLYDKFENFLSSKRFNRTLKCYEFNYLREIFNEFIKNYDGKDNELMEKLINLKDLLRTKILEINGDCTKEIDYFHPPEQYLKKKEEEREKTERVKLEEKQKLEAAKVIQPRKEEQHVQARAKQAEYNPAPLDKKAQESPEPRSLQVSQTSQETQDELRGRLLIQSQHAGTKLSESLGFEKTRTNLRDPELYESGYTITAPPSGEGIMDSIKGTFNRIVENVEPTPILGVSGGMGVLFIILKYTPVGTFFRGRGNRRLIPGRFGGEYPGFMPNFQGYEYGNFANEQFNIAYARE